MILPFGTIYGSQLHLGSLAGETHLFEHKHTVFDHKLSAQVVNISFKYLSMRNIGIQYHIDIPRNHKRIFVAIFCFFGKCLFLNRIFSSKSTYNIHQLFDIDHIRCERQIGFQHTVVTHIIIDIGHFTGQIEVGISKHKTALVYSQIVGSERKIYYRHTYFLFKLLCLYAYIADFHITIRKKL